MGVINDLNRKTQEITWVQSAELAESGLYFGIKSIKQTRAPKGMQWTLEIIFRPEDAKRLGVTGKVCFSLSCGSRDEFMLGLIPHLPQYNAYLEAIDLETGSIFYKIGQLEEDHEDYQEPPVSEVEEKKGAKKLTLTKRPIEERIKSRKEKSVVDKTSDDFDPFLDSDDLP